MTTPLKASDIVVLHGHSGFSVELFSLRLRVTNSGWSECEIGLGKDEVHEHRFNGSELQEIRDALEVLAEQVPEQTPWTMEDMGVYSLTFRIGDQIIHREVSDALILQQIDAPVSFLTAWDLITRPFKELHPEISIPLLRKETP